MQPLVEVRRIGSQDYAYRISAGGVPVHEADAAFTTLESCLFDAADSLGEYFPSVEVTLEGRTLGGCATALLRRLAQRLTERVELVR